MESLDGLGRGMLGPLATLRGLLGAGSLGLTQLISIAVSIITYAVTCRPRQGETLTRRQREWLRQHEWLDEPPRRPEHFLKLKPPPRRGGVMGYQSSPARRHTFHLRGDWIARNIQAFVDAPSLRALPTADEQKYLVPPFGPADLERLGLTLAEGKDEAEGGHGGGGEEEKS